MGMHVNIPVGLCQTICNRLSMITEGATVYLKGLLHGSTVDLTTLYWIKQSSKCSHDPLSV